MHLKVARRVNLESPQHKKKKFVTTWGDWCYGGNHFAKSQILLLYTLDEYNVIRNYISIKLENEFLKHILRKNKREHYLHILNFFPFIQQILNKNIPCVIVTWGLGDRDIWRSTSSLPTRSSWSVEETNTENGTYLGVEWSWGCVLYTKTRICKNYKHIFCNYSYLVLNLQWRHTNLKFSNRK